jgi:hypothetical protein
MKLKKLILFTLTICLSLLIHSKNTEKKYLSGVDSDNPVKWEFFCSDGMNSKKWTTIDVPSCWELKGFGEYNYGHVKFEKRLKETGIYKHKFSIPKIWKGKDISIVFEGVFTDTEVKINGKKIGAIHQGGFYEFKYDISKYLKYGQVNNLEVFVKKFSDNHSINLSERKADFWVFGGIFRPVYLEAKPKENIKRVEIDANANGEFYSNLILNSRSKLEAIAKLYDKGKLIETTPKFKAKSGIINIKNKFKNITSWNPENPKLYKIEFELLKNNKQIHKISEKIGFRTVDVRKRDGIYVNGKKIKFKGVNHHSFYPTKGRSCTKANSIEDVLLMKDMNMNAVRMSHYPPSKHFLDVCDSLGLFVLDELTGWQNYYDYEVGKKLVKELIVRDLNHPSIVLWDNGNENGWNRDLDKYFKQYDIQKRELLHPHGILGKMDTYHYFSYNFLSQQGINSDKILFPTEILHGLYDGGHGAGLNDYWNKMMQNKLSAGAFLWVFCDEGVVRVDKQDSIDLDGNHAPDGILGPYREKEGSYYTIKDIWSPIYIEDKYLAERFKTEFEIENRFIYTNLNECSYKVDWIKIKNFDKEFILKSSTHIFPDTKPNRKNTLSIKKENIKADYLKITAYDIHKRVIRDWTYPLTTANMFTTTEFEDRNDIQIDSTETEYHVKSGELEIKFSKAKGQINTLKNKNTIIPISNPHLIDKKEIIKSSIKYNSKFVTVTCHYKDGSYINQIVKNNGTLEFEISNKIRAHAKNIYFGFSFNFPENQVKSMKWIGNGPYRVWKNRQKGVKFGLWENTYNNTITGYSQKLEYPEFKGFYSNFYGLKLNLKNNKSITIQNKTEDLYLRMLTPEFPQDGRQTIVKFPSGDISFLKTIAPIGTKFKKPEDLGPESHPFQNTTKETQYLKMNLILDFNE